MVWQQIYLRRNTRTYKPCYRRLGGYLSKVSLLEEEGVGNSVNQDLKLRLSYEATGRSQGSAFW